MSTKYWLLKAEPDSRIVKGKDVKFSVDDFERVQTSPWEGVRNYEARNLMREMQVGEKAVFYHSNCKTPGIAGFAEVTREAYPDSSDTAWDSSHPYYDSKSDRDKPRWFMVDLTFSSRAKHFVPLVLLRHIADLAADTPPEEIKYIGEDGVKAIKSMSLVTRGRLSVQRVEPAAWGAIQQLAKNGGWDEIDFKPKKRPTNSDKKSKTPSKNLPKGARKVQMSKATEGDSLLSSPRDDEERPSDTTAEKSSRTTQKRKALASTSSGDPPRRSTRRKVAD